MRRRLGRTWVILLAVSGLLACWPAAAVQGQSGIQEDGTSGPIGNESPVSGLGEGNGQDYGAYQEQNPEAVPGETPIRLLAEDFTGGDGASWQEEYQGRGAMELPDNEAAWAEVLFQVPEDGLYRLTLEYYQLTGGMKDIQVRVFLDGEIPFTEAGRVSVPRLFKDETGFVTDEGTGNQYAPTQVEAPQWATETLENTEGLYREPYAFYLTAGTHTVRVQVISGGMALSGIQWHGWTDPPSYEDYVREHGVPEEGEYQKIYEAETPVLKSGIGLSPSNDMSSGSTSPSSPSKILINMIGSGWGTAGQWMEWSIEVPEDGYYLLSFRYRQDAVKGLSSHRRLTINGESPFQEAEDVSFPYSENWQGMSLSNSQGEPAYIWLEQGQVHTLRLEVVTADMSDVINAAGRVVEQLNDLYRQVIMITGSNPDKYQDYSLEESVPGIQGILSDCGQELERLYGLVQGMTKGKGNQAELLNRFAYQLKEFANDCESMPSRLTEFKDNNAALSSWLMDITGQPLELDAICVTSPGAAVPIKNDTFWNGLVYEVQRFFYSFIEDYSQFGTGDADIVLWYNNGRDQAQVLQNMINTMFTPQTGIRVQIKLINTSLIQAVLSGDMPDVSITQPRGQPVNLAARGALLPLEDLEGFDELAAQFQPTALDPYMLEGSCYAIPDYQNFFMMFYRTDIFEELGLEPPATWEELRGCITQLQRNHMEVGLPYTGIDAYGAIDSGMGSRNIFSALLLQRGGSVYNDDLSRTALSDESAQEAFVEWVNFYDLYGLDLTYDFYSRFRTGEMPLGISSYTMYNQLYAAAPEIRGLWKMAPIPGTPTEEGITRAQGGSGTAAFILKETEHPEESWEFIKWWTGAEAQARYSRDIESAMGVAGRYATANIEAFATLDWSDEEYSVLMEQWMQVEEIPEAVGGYYLARGLDNAFREAVQEGRDPREALLTWNKSINNEIQRKREEFHYE